jgi:hypothetical protein
LGFFFCARFPPREASIFHYFPSKTKVLYEFVGILVSKKLLVKYF